MMIHKFNINDVLMVLDVHSGSVYRFDPLAWDLVDDYLSYNRQELIRKYALSYHPTEIEETLDELDALVERDLLFSADPLAGVYEPVEQKMMKALCLHLAHDCNLGCRYCFAGQGKFGGQAGFMSVEVGRDALELLFKNSGSRQHVEVDFFGGEPLLNQKVMFQLVEYGKKRAVDYGKEISFTLTTNALLLNQEVAHFLNQQDMNVVLSIDGRPAVHNAMRPLVGGADSYALVVKKIKEFLNTRNYQKYYVRGTYTNHNLDFTADVLHLVDLGFKEVSIEPVIASSEDEYALQDEHLPNIMREYVRLADIMLERKGTEKEFHFFHFNLDLSGGPCLPKRLTGCNAGVEYFAVDPQGDLYPCHQFVGQKEFIVGNVSQGILREDIRSYFAQSHVYAKEDCQKCWAKYYCSGGCHAAAWAFGGDILKPNPFACKLMKRRIECALYMKTVASES